MSRPGQDVTGRQSELTQFRHDIHNTLAWGISKNRKKHEEPVQTIMNKARLQKPRRGAESSGLGKIDSN